MEIEVTAFWVVTLHGFTLINQQNDRQTNERLDKSVNQIFHGGGRIISFILDPVQLSHLTQQSV